MELMDEWMVNRWTDGSMDGWMGETDGEWVNEWMYE